jgi:CubicO group peptidase (beta-lactamase class C family)
MTTLDRSAVDALRARVRRDVDDGLLPACQVALALDGEIVVHEAFGDADLDTRFTVFSATKPFIAALVWQLLAEGALRPEQLVHELIPEFGSHGKDVITLDHVLLHTSGFPRAPLVPPKSGRAR